MPVVAAIAKPSSWKTRAAARPVALSRSASDMKTQPALGQPVPRGELAFANARPKVRSMPMTSPVERISGPSTRSASGKRLNGSTASFTAT